MTRLIVAIDTVIDAVHYVNQICRAEVAEFQRLRSAVKKGSGECGIRTHDTLLRYTAFPVPRLRPLGQLSGSDDPVFGHRRLADGGRQSHGRRSPPTGSF